MNKRCIHSTKRLLTCTRPGLPFHLHFIFKHSVVHGKHLFFLHNIIPKIKAVSFLFSCQGFLLPYYTTDAEHLKLLQAAFICGGQTFLPVLNRDSMLSTTTS